MGEEQEINSKRKRDDEGEVYQVSKKAQGLEERDLRLTLGPYGPNIITNLMSEPLSQTLLPPQEQQEPLPPLQPELPQQQQEPHQVSPSLSIHSTLYESPPPQFPLQLPATHPLYNVNVPFVSQTTSPLIYPQETESSGTGSVSRSARGRKNPTQAAREGKSETIPPPFPWATSHRATVHSMSYLLSKQIFTITGDVQCKRCERHYEIGYNLKEKFAEIGSFIAENKSAMHDRAPPVWMTPVLPKCKFCDQENSAKPLIAERKKSINWLFLLLGQMLGCCTLDQLKYFCKHTKNHRTGAKDRVLYLTYLGLCKQLDPNGPFTR